MRTEEAFQGQKTITTVIILVVLIKIASSLFSYFAITPQSINYHLFGVVATCAVCYYLYKGKRWAKHIIVVAMILGISSSLGIGMMRKNLNSISFIFFMLQAVVYLAIILLLLIPKQNKAYFNSLGKENVNRASMMKERTTITEIIKGDRTNITKYDIYWDVTTRQLTSSTDIILKVNDESIEEGTRETERKNNSDYELCVTGQEMNQILTEIDRQIESPEIDEYIKEINNFLKSNKNKEHMVGTPKDKSLEMKLDLVAACVGTYVAFFIIFLGFDIMKDTLVFPLLIIFSAPIFIFSFLIGGVMIGTLYKKLIVNNHESPDVYRIIYFLFALCVIGLGIVGHFTWLSDKMGIHIM